MVNNPLPTQETQQSQVQSLGGEDPLEEEIANPLQYSCLGNLMDRGAWQGPLQSIVHGVAKSGTRLK